MLIISKHEKLEYSLRSKKITVVITNSFYILMKVCNIIELIEDILRLTAANDVNRNRLHEIYTAIIMI